MALSFPSSPTTNQTYSSNGQTWIWDSIKWKLVTSNTVFSDTAPTSPAPGTMWVDTTTMIEFSYYGGQWVQMPLGGAGNTIYMSVGVLGSTQLTTSGTYIDFTGLPLGVKMIIVSLAGVSTNGSSAIQLQIGSSSISTSGYDSHCAMYSVDTTSTTGFLLDGYASQTASTVRYSTVTLTSMGGNKWSIGGTLVMAVAGYPNVIVGGTMTLSGNLDRVRLTTVNGTDTFDAGSANILYYT